MNRIFTVFGLLLLCVAAHAQKFQPNTRWPYLYENFMPGTIYFKDNTKSSADMNIHLQGNVLHYTDKEGHILESNVNQVTRVEIDGDAYVCIGTRLMRIVDAAGPTDKLTLLLCLVRGDFDAMREKGGAYGSSLNSAAARDLSSLDLGGLDSPLVGKLLQEKKDGRDIPLVTEYYFYHNGQLLDANKHESDKLAGAERTDEWKQFVKTNKIKWKREVSLRQVLHFLFP